MLSLEWVGFSGVNFALFAYATVDFIFNFKRDNKLEKIIGSVMMAAFYLCSCFDVALGIFTWYPFELIVLYHNAIAIISGAVLCLIYKVVAIMDARVATDEKTETNTLNKILSDANGRKIYKWNNNYFFCCTICITALCFILYGVGGNSWPDIIIKDPQTNLLKLFAMLFCNTLCHHNFQHVIGNMMCFFVLGIYLERKHGSLPLLLLILSMAFFTEMIIASTWNSYTGRGYSGVNFALYGYVIVDYFFVMAKKNKTKFEIISGLVMMGLIYLAMCHNGGTEKFGFAPYPYDLINNAAHYTGITVGIVLTLCIKTVIKFSRIERAKIEEENRLKW